MKGKRGDDGGGEGGQQKIKGEDERVNDRGGEKRVNNG